MRHEKVSRELGRNYISLCFKLTLNADIQIAMQQIFKRFKNIIMTETTIKTIPSIKTKIFMYAIKIHWLKIFILLKTFDSSAQVFDTNDSSFSPRDTTFFNNVQCSM